MALLEIHGLVEDEHLVSHLSQPMIGHEDHVDLVPVGEPVDPVEQPAQCGIHPGHGLG